MSTEVAVTPSTELLDRHVRAGALPGAVALVDDRTLALEFRGT